MKNYMSCFLFLILVSSCGEQKNSDQVTQQQKAIEHLPFTQIELQNLDAFEPVTENWTIVGDAEVDQSLPKKIKGTSGTGVLLNIPKKGSRKNLFTNFEHGDIELDLDVMMPIGSNSGIYLQGRYEIQLFDSWKIKEPTYSDMGAIYQRWDKTAEKGKQGYEGHPPAINASKAPGLWQHIKIKFSAPTFNKAGNKTKNAKFDEVWLNGVLLHENIEVTGPTRAAAFDTEIPMAPIMIQGDHGPVALKNIKYKLYKKQNITFSDLNFKEHNTTYEEKIPNLNMVEESKNETVKAISLENLKSRSYNKTLLYTGKLHVPETGEYLFNFKADGGGIGVLLINNDTIKSNIMTLTKEAPVPFSLAISKAKPLIEHFELSFEGPGIKKQSLDSKLSLSEKTIKTDKSMTVSAKEGAIVQRSFLRHHGEIRTHCISVGTPEGIHYAYDMNLGSLLSVWSGDDFFDATLMWTSRGGEQFGRTGALTMPMFGYSEFASLKDNKTPWVSKNDATKFIGYDFDSNGRPIFTNIIEGTTITNEFSPIVKHRGINRNITTNGTKELFHKINEGESIKLLKDGTYIINNDSYFVKFSNKNSIKPFIRKSNGKEELLVKIPSGKQIINYTIIW
ncbi:family 16 glycoside hydrolase [Mariniflexile sp. AS56]|uniref:family 16 glycoside hydrolase n=1 Tax=Mariniflexile sp. AS56 TaxID=3063957 RepID=UPI0026F2C59C|nr:family 16 glycoside hydrolase [Mariniflexile sp. AS56]MDO7172399.1 DUF1080 domain-containing protein [Mariniflexile sp. AS56]